MILMSLLKDNNLKGILNSFILPLIFLTSNLSIDVYANDKNQILNKEYKLQNNLYILGPGDNLFLRIIEFPELSGDIEILSDGTIQVPFVGTFLISGKTIDEAKKVISRELSNELLKPNVDIIIKKTRPIRVSLVGQLARPGIYSLTNNEKTQTQGGPVISNSGIPTLIDAIQKAGGITQKANLKEVNLHRKLPGNDNLYKKTKINLLDLIFKGDQTQNPYLFDGDIIKINEASSIHNTPNEIASANLSPSKISVSVIGEVVKPGKIELASNTPLIQAILAAGGPTNWRANRGDVKLIRINRNGSAYVQRFKLDLNKSIGQDNPPLLSGDVISIERSSITKSTDALREVTKPASDLVTIFTLIKLFE